MTKETVIKRAIKIANGQMTFFNTMMNYYNNEFVHSKELRATKEARRVATGQLKFYDSLLKPKGKKHG
jgi:hypothetical protein